MKERKEGQRKKVKIQRDDYKPSQEELLEEARETEIINLKSLGIKITKTLNIWFWIFIVLQKNIKDLKMKKRI